MRNLPDKCLRSLECQPLHAVVSDEADTFVCCGLHGAGGRDPYRMCFKSVETDTMYDHDKLDLLDMAEVITRSLSTAQRLNDMAEERH